MRRQSFSRTGKKKRKNRRRNVTWFNPPYSRSVLTNIGRRFCTLISKHFPRNSKLSKIFNTNTLKLSYSCLSNMAAVISQHNSSILRVGGLLAKVTRVEGHVTAASRRTARWTAHAKCSQWCTRQSSRRWGRPGITLVWPCKPSNSAIMRTCTSVRWRTAYTVTACPCWSTSGPSRINTSATTHSVERAEESQWLPKHHQKV